MPRALPTLHRSDGTSRLDLARLRYSFKCNNL